MTAYYNEWDKGAAEWLRVLIAEGHIAPGIVDTRSITEVVPDDLRGFTQCHFFAGIGGWSLALRLAGVPDTAAVWTGSPPCQPFSAAGGKLGFTDPRHLAPALLDLIAECRPGLIFGEQVKDAIGKHWLDFIFLDMEAEGYACGASVLPAASVGSPHKRDRLFFGAHLLADNHDCQSLKERISQRAGDAWRESFAFELANDYHLRQPLSFARDCTAGILPGQRDEAADASAGRGGDSVVGDLHGTRPQGWERMPERTDQRAAGQTGVAGRHAGPTNGFWSAADWLGCRDGKLRPVEPGTFPLADGVPARVGRVRGYGNAIVPQVAAEFVKGYIGARDDIFCGL